MNELPINGQGVRLVKQSEGIDIPFIQPWEVEGEKELLESIFDRSQMPVDIYSFEKKLLNMYEHIQTCESLDCSVKRVFDEIMDFRRKYCLLFLKDNQIEVYGFLYSLILIYTYSKGDKVLFTKVISGALEAALSFFYERLGKLKRYFK